MKLALFTGQCLDAASFALVVTLVPALGGHELNPVIAATYALGGVLAVVALKVGWASFLCWRLTVGPVVSGNVSRIVTAIVLAATASGYIGAAFNLRALLGVLAA